MSNIQLQEGNHLRDYWHVLLERKWTTLTCMILVVGVGALLTWMQDPVYRSEAKVELQVQAANPLQMHEGTSQSRSAYFKESYFQTQFEIIRSRDLLTASLQHESLRNVEPFASAADPAGLIGSMLKLEIVPSSDVMVVAAEGGNPELCATVANAVSETYVDWNVNRRIQTLLNTQASLQEHLADEVAALEELADETYKEAQKRNTLTPEFQQELSQDALRGLQEELRAAESQDQQVSATLSQARNAKNNPSLELSLGGLQDDNLSALLKSRQTLQEELKSLQAVYKENHPEIRSTIAKIGDVTGRVVTGLEAYQRTTKDRVNRLRTAVRRERAMVMQAQREAAPLQSTEIKRQSREALLTSITQRLDELGLLATKDLLVNQAQIIEQARPRMGPIRPNVKMNLLVAGLLGVLVGVGSAFFLDYLDVSIKTVEDVEKGLGQNVLCTVPAESKKVNPLIQESIQSLRTALIFADKAKPTSTVLFTSATPKEGKSSTVVRLAKALAAGGAKTIVLDCDFRLPTMSHHFKVSRDKGLASYVLDEEESWPDHIAKGVAPGLDLFTTGPLPPNPTDLLVSPRLSTLLSLLAREYDWVLVDAPPVTSMSDAVLLSDRVDGVVFVVRYDHVDQRTVQRALGSLEAVGARILGVVLNAVDTKKPGYRDYFYGRYAYYGEARRSESDSKHQLTPVSGGRN